MSNPITDTNPAGDSNTRKLTNRMIGKTLKTVRNDETNNSNNVPLSQAAHKSLERYMHTMQVNNAPSDLSKLALSSARTYMQGIRFSTLAITSSLDAKVAMPNYAITKFRTDLESDSFKQGMTDGFNMITKGTASHNSHINMLLANSIKNALFSYLMGAGGLYHILDIREMPDDHPDNDDTVQLPRSLRISGRIFADIDGTILQCVQEQTRARFSYDEDEALYGTGHMFANYFGYNTKEFRKIIASCVKPVKKYLQQIASIDKVYAKDSDIVLKHGICFAYGYIHTIMHSDDFDDAPMLQSCIDNKEMNTITKHIKDIKPDIDDASLYDITNHLAAGMNTVHMNIKMQDKLTVIYPMMAGIMAALSDAKEN